jgi:hypothetical protein
MGKGRHALRPGDDGGLFWGFVLVESRNGGLSRTRG